MSTYKVVEAILMPGTDDNGFFDFIADLVKKAMPTLGQYLIPQKNEQKSIVVRGNDIWACQYYFNLYSSDTYEINAYLSTDNNQMHVVTRDDEIPDTDIYRVATTYLWTALGDFFNIPITAKQKQALEIATKQSSNGTFIYEERYHDIRSYTLDRSATVQEIALLLSFELVNNKYRKE